MKKKNGFTLVELLAVISILAILAIITLPNIMKLFNEAKKNTFINEAKTIYKTAENQFISESMFSSGEKVYSRCEEGCPDNLSLSGRKNINYYIKISNQGKVKEFYVTDGTYQYGYKGNNFNIENISMVDEISQIDPDEVISITSTGGSSIAGSRMIYKYYRYDEFTYLIDDDLSEVTSYSTPEEAMEDAPKSFVIKAGVQNNILKEMYFGFLVNGNITYIKARDTAAYSNNLTTLLTAIGQSDCNEYDNKSVCSLSDYYERLTLEASISANIDGSVSFCIVTRLGPSSSKINSYGIRYSFTGNTFIDSNAISQSTCPY